jgi:hypothetical protein
LPCDPVVVILTNKLVPKTGFPDLGRKSYVKGFILLPITRIIMNYDPGNHDKML